MIPQETIEQIREATDVVDIISNYVRLKKRGRDMWGLCPFHQEKTPSFKVSADKQLFYCFGCGKGGNVFTFLMEHEHMSFADALRFLAQKANITIRETGSDYKREITERLNYAHQVAVEYFQKTLRHERYRVVLRDYLKKRRGISDESIETFQLGLSGEEWDGLIRFAGKRDITPKELEQAGLAGLSERTGKHFDRFRQRLMFPIYNLSSKPIAFGGRTMKKGEPAKYINSPETPLYNKSRVLYGLNFARDYVRDANEVFVVEGYFDVISLWQAGIRNVVASSGTAFTPYQARLLARFADNVYLFFDADSAGRNAALRSVDSLFDAGLEVKVMSAKSGEDPDSIAREGGAEAVQEIKQSAQSYILFRVKDTDINNSGIIGREKLVKELAALAAKISDPTRRALFVQEAADRLGVDQQLLQTARDSATPAISSQPPSAAPSNKVEFDFLSLLLNNPGSIDDVFERISPEDFDSRQMARLYSAMVTQYNMDGTLEHQRLLAKFEDD
ncbi:DNA primase, partial [candidate division GN15 bacterium]|nr:DNA primase [candidate division GN15 bacterium]